MLMQLEGVCWILDGCDGFCGCVKMLCLWRASAKPLEDPSEGLIKGHSLARAGPQWRALDCNRKAHERITDCLWIVHGGALGGPLRASPVEGL